MNTCKTLKRRYAFPVRLFIFRSNRYLELKLSRIGHLHLDKSGITHWAVGQMCSRLCCHHFWNCLGHTEMCNLLNMAMIAFLSRLGLSAERLARPEHRVQLPGVTTHLFGSYNSPTVNRRICLQFAHDTQVFCKQMNISPPVPSASTLYLSLQNYLCTLLKTPTHLNILTFINVTKTSCTPQFKQFVSQG